MKISVETGSGVFATKDFAPGQFLLEYVGRRLSIEDYEARYRTYEQRKYKHYYIFHFQITTRKHRIDATNTRGRLCHLVNDAPQKTANAVMKMKIFNGYPRLCLFSRVQIKISDEIRYDYGDENLKWSSEMMEPTETETSPKDIDEDPFDLRDEEIFEGGQNEQAESSDNISDVLDQEPQTSMSTEGTSPEGFWVGSTDIEEEGTWRWNDGTPMVSRRSE